VAAASRNSRRFMTHLVEPGFAAGIAAAQISGS
jgi:hypothetical protein